MANIPFTSNYTDLSSPRGYQFQFFCQKCGNGYMSTFKTSPLGVAASAANAAASMLGGIFGRAAQSAQALQSAVAGPAHDAALDAAVREVSRQFKQCTRCGHWVCEPVCWNTKAGLCEACAPDLNEEIAAAQAQAAREQAAAKAREVDFLGARDLSRTASVLCPQCGAKVQGGKFCPECGKSVSPRRTCGHCGVETDGAPKFCPECGKPY